MYEITKPQLKKIGQTIEKINLLVFKLNKRYRLYHYEEHDKKTFNKYTNLLEKKYQFVEGVEIMRLNKGWNALFTLIDLLYTTAEGIGDFDILYNNSELNQYIKIVD